MWILVLGIASGARSMTAMAVVCWFGWLRLFPLQHTWAFWVGNLVSAIIFLLLALGEYVGDTLPGTPPRTALFPFGARLAFGGLVGAVAATALMEPVAGGVILGLVGALIGTFAGLRMRLRLAERVGRDRPVAITESVAALVISLVAAHMIHLDAVKVAAQEGRTFF